MNVNSSDNSLWSVSFFFFSHVKLWSHDFLELWILVFVLQSPTKKNRERGCPPSYSRLDQQCVTRRALELKNMTFPEHVEDWYFFFNFNTSVLNSTSNVCKPAIYSASSRNKRKFRLPRRDPRETAEKRSLFADFEMSKYTHADVDFCGKKIKKKYCLSSQIRRHDFTWILDLGYREF